MGLLYLLQHQLANPSPIGLGLGALTEVRWFIRRMTPTMLKLIPPGVSKQTSWVDWTLGIARRLESSQDHQFNCSPTPEIFGLNLGQVRSPPLPAGWQALWGRSACRGPLLDLEIYFWIKPRAKCQPELQNWKKQETR